MRNEGKLQEKILDVNRYRGRTVKKKALNDEKVYQKEIYNGEDFSVRGENNVLFVSRSLEGLNDCAEC